jgi:hypothetical protein
MRKLFGGAAEDLREPADSLLVRDVHEGAVAEDIRQSILARIRLPVRHLLRRPEVPPPSHKRQRKENGDDGSCYKNCCQNSSSHARKSDSQIFRAPKLSATPENLTSNVKVSRCLSMAKVLRLIEVSLQRSSSADVQGNAMGPTAQQFGVAQLQRDYIKTLLL